MRDNIAFGKPHDRDEIIRVIQLVKLNEHDEFINAENDQILEANAEELDRFS